MGFRWGAELQQRVIRKRTQGKSTGKHRMCSKNKIKRKEKKKKQLGPKDNVGKVCCVETKLWGTWPDKAGKVTYRGVTVEILVIAAPPSTVCGPFWLTLMPSSLASAHPQPWLYWSWIPLFWPLPLSTTCTSWLFGPPSGRGKVESEDLISLEFAVLLCACWAEPLWGALLERKGTS